jgi:hypothetical protein
VKGNFAGEAVRSAPRNQTSVSFKSGAMATMQELVENIPYPKAKNQMKLASGRSLYHKKAPLCDMSDKAQNDIVL